METLSSAELARWAKRLREEQGLSLADVGKRVGKSRQAVHQAEDEEKAGMDSLRLAIIQELGGEVVEGPLYIRRTAEQGSDRAEEQKSKAA